MLKSYIKDHIWNIILCAVMSGSIIVCACQGFNLDAHAISDSLIAAILLSAVCQMLLTLSAYNRKTIIAGVIGALILAGAFMILLNIRNVDIVDEIDSSTVIYIYPIILYIANILVFLPAQFRIGTAVLFILGTLVIGGLYYLEFDSSLLWLILFLMACICQFILLEYRANALQSVQYEPAFQKTGALGTGMTAAALILSLIVFFGIIHPLHPGAKDLTLLTQHIGIESLNVTGIMDDYPVVDPDLYSTNIDDSEQDEVDEDADSESELQEGEDQDSSDETDGSSSDENATGSGEERTAQAITYEKVVHTLPRLILSAVLLFALLIGGKLLYRSLWLKKISERSAEEQIRLLYQNFLKKFSRVGVGRIPSDSVRVFLSKNEETLERYSKGSTDFRTLTGVFERVKYGNESATKEECAAFHVYYRSFYKNCREILGTLNYARKFFFL